MWKRWPQTTISSLGGRGTILGAGAARQAPSSAPAANQPHQPLMSTLYTGAAALALSLCGACRSLASGPVEPELAFEIRAPQRDDPAVRCSMRTRAGPDGECALEQKGDWGGTEDSPGGLEEVRAFRGDGRELPLEAQGHGHWSLRANPREALRVSWLIPRNEILLSP